MSASILDGKATAAEVKADLKERVAALAARGILPGLGTILVGDDPGSQAYVGGKHRDCAQVGIASIRRDLPATATQQQVEEAVAEPGGSIRDDGVIAAAQAAGVTLYFTGVRHFYH